MTINQENNHLYQSLSKTVYLAVSIFLILIFFYAIKTIILLFTVSFIFAIALNPVTTKLEEKKLSRGVATLITLVAIVSFFMVLGILIIPSLINEIAKLLDNLPKFTLLLSNRISDALQNYPNIKKQINLNTLSMQFLPTLQAVLSRLGQYSVSVFNTLIFLVIFFSIVIYSLLSPRPLFKAYLYLFPNRLKTKAVKAFVNGSNIIIAWIWSSFVIGAIEGISVTIFLTIFGVPGAVLWGGLTFVGELIPRIGPFIAAIPPIAVAFTISPLKALWVIVFYIVLNEVTGNVLAPYIRATQMKLHPVLIIFAVVSLTYLFGFLGTLIATPVAGFVKAYLDEFYFSSQKKKSLDKKVEMMLKRIKPTPLL